MTQVSSSGSGWVSWMLHRSQLLIPPPQLENIISPVPPMHTSVQAALVQALPAFCGQGSPSLLAVRLRLALLGCQQGNAAIGCFASRAQRAGSPVEGDQGAPKGAMTSPSSTAVCRAKRSPRSQHSRPRASATAERLLFSKLVPFRGYCPHSSDC